MRATGIIRRIDDLGRVVIPKEIRRQLKINDGDPLEIFTNDNQVILCKYDPIDTETWEKAKNIISYLINGNFGILNQATVEVAAKGDYSRLQGEQSFDYGIIVYDSLRNTDNEIAVIVEVLNEFLRTD